MKKSCFFLFVAVALLTSSAQAQQAPDLRTQATENTRKLAQQISLDDARVPQVKRLAYERLVQENDLKQMYSVDPALLQSKMAVVEKEYADKLKAVLSDLQYQRYLAATAPVAAPTVAVAPAPAPSLISSPPAAAPLLPVAKTAKAAPQSKPKTAAPARKTSGAHASTARRAQR